MAHNIPFLYQELNRRYHFDKQFRYATADIPILGDINKAIDSLNYANDYLANRGISWDDVKYPTMMKGAGNGFYSAFRASDKSVEDLYKSEERKRERYKNEYSRALRNEHYRTAIDANNMRRAWYYSRL